MKNLVQLAGMCGATQAYHAVREEQNELRLMADKVVLQRPDLSQASILEQIEKMSIKTVYGRSHWAQVCLDKAYAGSPLPWETGYLESQYLTLLSRSLPCSGNTL